MTDSIRNLVAEWSSEYDDDQADTTPEFELILDQLEYLKDKLFIQFAPCLHGCKPFEFRFEKWIDNVANQKDKQLLFNLVPLLFFVGQEEMNSLCRQAFVGPFSWWFYELKKASWETPGLNELFQSFAESTWFCPLTDSFPISHFCHINKVSGQTHRPDWRSLQKLGDPAKINSFMKTNNLDQLVLLEDFVGTGKQMKTAVEFAASIDPNIPILLVPLISTYRGIEAARLLCSKLPNVTCHPIVILSENDCIPETKPQFEVPYKESLRLLLTSVHNRLKPFTQASDDNPFGFKGNGALAIMYSNCPNNAPPVIHHSSPNWAPLFPRVSRQ